MLYLRVLHESKNKLKKTFEYWLEQKLFYLSSLPVTADIVGSFWFPNHNQTQQLILMKTGLT